MKSNAQKFIECLEDAEDILGDYPSVTFSNIDIDIKYAAPEHFNLALFEQWSEICEPETHQKPPVRLIQHLSCTGGTLICKCLAAMPNVTLLSEVNPLSQLHIHSDSRFTPTDLVSLARQGKFPLIEELCEKIFKADVGVIAEHVKQLGKYLVIREHSHSDFMVGESPSEFSTIRKLLQDDHPVLSILTVRHPIDSYLSLTNVDWLHFIPTTFDEYCRRYLLFIEYNKGLPVFKYEDFVVDPENEMKQICEVLDLPFNEDFQDIFDINVMSGDSGRSSSTIEIRDRRKYDDAFREELNESAMYARLCEVLGYSEQI